MSTKNDKNMQPHERPLEKYKVRSQTEIKKFIFECHRYRTDGCLIQGIIDTGPINSKTAFLLHLAPGEWLEPIE